MITAFVIALILSCMQRVNKTTETGTGGTGLKNLKNLTLDYHDLSTPDAAVIQVEHVLFDELLQLYVDPEGRVDYGSFKKNEARLDRYLQALASNAPTAEDSPAKRMAYWINAYNAYTIKVILENYPVKSIRDLADGNIWDVRWIKIDGRILSLNDIEHRILREKFDDARIHFALNCAAASCPPLWNRAFTSGNLERALDQRTTEFINDPRYNQVDQDRADLSMIFDWYREDFGDLVSYINQYSETQLAPDATIIFNEYDWSLNGR